MARPAVGVAAAVAVLPLLAAAVPVRVPAAEAAALGTDASPYPDDAEGPPRTVRLEAFDVGDAEATVEEFAAFCGAARFETDAERHGVSFVYAPLLTGGREGPEEELRRK